MKRRSVIAAIGVFMAAAMSCGGRALNSGGTGGNGAVAGTTGAAGTSAAGTGGAIGGTGGSTGGTGLGGTGGSIGGTGSGGVAGTSAAGTGGAALPACGAGASDTIVEMQLVGSDGTLVAATVTAAVTVAANDSCGTVACPPGISTKAMRISLTAVGAQSWTLYLRNDAMPLGVIRLGDTFDLKVDASVDSTFYRTVDQTVVLARGANLIAFAASLHRFYRLAVPRLDGFGIAVSDEGASCESQPSTSCIPRPHRAGITAGSSSASALPGQTVTVDWLSFTNGGFTELADAGACDSKSTTSMAGFRTAGIAGRVQVTQPGTGSAPGTSTDGLFAMLKPCTGQQGVASCTCTGSIENITSGCGTLSCRGYLNYPQLDELLGYRYILADAVSAVALDAGDLNVRNGSTSFDYQLPYHATDMLSAPWQTGDAITIGASGAQVPAFSTTIPFPPRVTFLEPDLNAASIAFPDTLAVRWTPTQGTGRVEATAASYFWPDAQSYVTITRCSAPVSAGELMIPIPARSVQTFGDGGRGLSVRVVNTAQIQQAGLAVDVRVASFDSGRINERLPSPDGGADAP